MSDGERSDPVYIDTVDGDDKNDGATMVTALKTYDEYFRRSLDDFDEGAEAGLHVVVIDPSKSDVEIAEVLARKEGLVRLMTAPVGVGERPSLGLALTSSTNPDIKQAEPVRMNRSMRMAKASLEKRLKKRGARIVETTQRAWTSGLGGEQGLPGVQGEGGSGGTRR